MAVLNMRTLFCLVFLYCYSQAAPRNIRAAVNGFLTLTTSEDNIYEGQTRDLTIECRIPDSSSGVYSQVVSLFISRKDSTSTTFQDIATISGLDPNNVILMGITATASGRIDENDSSFIRLTWPSPNRNEAGVYQCEANVLTPTGHSLTFTDQVEVIGSDVLVEAITARVRELENRLRLYEDRIAQATLSLFTNTTYNGSTYYFSQYELIDVVKAEATCNLAGAHLVEINDRAEYAFLVQALNSSQFYEADERPREIYIGLTDRPAEGSWVYWHSGQLATFYEWADNEPRPESFDCAILNERFSYKYYAVNCLTGYKYFVCEKEDPVV